MDAVKKLLVIDDEPAIREGVRRILESESFQVETLPMVMLLPGADQTGTV